MSHPVISRRRFVVVAGFAGFAATRFSAGAAEPDAGHADPRRSNRALVKLLGSLDGTPAPWWFAGNLYAIQPGRRPVPMVRCEGCEIYFPRRLEPDGYLLGGATLTFFRDVVSGEWLDVLQNPLTGRRNPVKPNILHSSPKAGFLYPDDGSAPHFVGPMGATGQLNYKPPEHPADPPRGELVWEQLGDRLFVTTSRGIDTPAQPWLEVSTSITSATALFDPATTTVAADGAVTYASPWLKWMDMDEVPGHLMWHAATHKLGSLRDLPRGYRQHAEQLGLLNTLSPPSS